MQLPYILVLSLACILPKDKIHCPINDMRVAVKCSEAKFVEEIFRKHGLKVIYKNDRGNLGYIEDRFIIVAQWQNEVRTYKTVKELFFHLARRKEVLRIY